MLHKPKQIPYPLLWDRMPLDISSAFGEIRAAGSDGFVQTKGDKFILENTGEEIRFWGVNVNAGACFPTHYHAEAVARRLRMAGQNILRFHQLDAEWSTPNIFQFTQGAQGKGTRHLDPDSMDRLDYFIYCLKKNGIYIYMDFITYRRFKPEDGVEGGTRYLREGARPQANFSRQLIELQKEYMVQILEHVNPYTGLAYKDEPAIAMAEIANENCLFNKWKIDFEIEPFHTELCRLYDTWAAENGKSVENYSFLERDPQMNEFFIYLQKKFWKEMYIFLRESGAKFAITGTNWYVKEINYCSEEMDFTDAHTYLWLGHQAGIKNMPHIKQDKSMARNLSLSCRKGKPFVVSEWDALWPNEFRADTTVWFAALGALQGWNGFAIHTYRYDCCEDESVTKKIGQIRALGGVFHRGAFPCFNDPAKFGLFYHAALLFRRGDVKRAEKTVEFKMEREELLDQNWIAMDHLDTSWVERHRVEVKYDGEAVLAERADTERRSDTGEIFRNVAQGIGTIDTERTKAVYGFIGDKEFALSGVKVKVENDFATVAMSSLNDTPITESSNILLTMVGRAENTDEEFNADRSVMTKEGKAPIMIDVIEAEITIETSQPYMKVWSVSYDGFLTGEVPSEYKEGKLCFQTGKDYPSMYYLIQAQ